jgi:hypothetical protein
MARKAAPARWRRPQSKGRRRDSGRVRSRVSSARGPMRFPKKRDSRVLANIGVVSHPVWAFTRPGQPRPACSPRDRRAELDLLPDLLTRTNVLLRILRPNRRTRRAVRAVPAVVCTPLRSLKCLPAAGKPPRGVRHVLGSSNLAATSLTCNARASQALKRPARTPRHCGLGAAASSVRHERAAR